MIVNSSWYRRSFWALLIVNVINTLLFGFLSGFDASLKEYILGFLIWFVFFYWIPAWAAGATILTLRERGRSHWLLEWLIATICCGFFYILTVFVNFLILDEPMRFEQLFWIAPFWATLIYGVSQAIEHRIKLKLEKDHHHQTQLSALRFQLDPHFLFNSLNTVSAYIYKWPEKADMALHHIADVLRYSLDTGTEQWVTIEQDMDILQKYLKIEQFRFGEKLVFSFSSAKPILKKQIPPLLIQPAVENAIKHGKRNGYVDIEIVILEIDGLIQISIRDKGPGFNDKILQNRLEGGKGLQLMSERIKLLPEGKMTLENDNGAKVEIQWKSPE